MNGARALSRAEVAAVVREVYTRRDRALFAVMLYTGARISEALALDVVDVVRADGAPRPTLTLWRRNTKGQRVSRAIETHPEVAGAVRLYLAERGHPAGDGPLFVSRNGGRLSRPQAWRRMREAFDAAGLAEGERCSPHSLRKTFAQRLHDAGVDLPEIQELLGHADIRDTRAYFEVSEDACRKAVLDLPSEGLAS